MSQFPDSSPTASAPDADSPETPRVIGPVAAFSIVAGSMLGVGIFLLPTQVAQNVDTVWAFLGLWLAGGVFALAGASACGELGAMLPKAGGDYVFQRAAFGPSVAFASGWVLFAAIFSGSVASMSVAVFQYQMSALFGVDLTQPVFDGLGITGAQLGAIGLIIVLTALNDAGTRLSARAQTLMTLLPIATLVVLAIYAIIAAPGPPAEAAAAAPKIGATELSLTGLALGYLSVNFAFSGWINIIYVAGEVKRPEKTIASSMFSGTLAVTALYLLLCAAFLAVLGLSGVAALGWTDAGTGMAKALGSPWLATAVLIVIAVAILTSLNATVLASARVAYAMAKGGAFWRGAAQLSRRDSPQRALWIQACIASIIVLSGTFEEIIAMTSLAMFATGTLTVLSLFVLRWRQPNAPRPYRATGYPWFPALYVISSVLVAVMVTEQAITGDNPNAWFPLLGVGVLVVAFMLHWLLSRHAKRATGVVVGVLLAGLALSRVFVDTPT